FSFVNSPLFKLSHFSNLESSKNYLREKIFSVSMISDAFLEIKYRRDFFGRSTIINKSNLKNTNFCYQKRPKLHVNFGLLLRLFFLFNNINWSILNLNIYPTNIFT